jgi:hypothetical protein
MSTKSALTSAGRPLAKPASFSSALALSGSYFFRGRLSVWPITPGGMNPVAGLAWPSINSLIRPSRSMPREIAWRTLGLSNGLRLILKIHCCVSTAGTLSTFTPDVFWSTSIWSGGTRSTTSLSPALRPEMRVVTSGMKRKVSLSSFTKSGFQ